MNECQNSPLDSCKVELQPQGGFRYFEAIFLVVWLSFWALGELFVAGVLLSGAYSLLTGLPITGDNEPPELSSALLIGSFLLFWLTFWTIGGLAALNQLCSIVWAKDSLTLSDKGLSLTKQIGPIVKHQLFPATTLEAAYIRSYQQSLMLQSAGRVQLLSNLGSLDERKAAAELIQKNYSLQTANGPLYSVALPDDWSESKDSSGQSILIPNPETRRQYYYICLAISLLCWLIAYSLVIQIPKSSTVAIPALIAALIASWLSRQSAWLKNGRYEWLLESGRITLRRFYKGQTEILGSATLLEISSSEDSDNDTWYELNVTGTTGELNKRRFKNLTKNMNDDSEARILAAWLAKRSEVPINDLTAQKKREVYASL